MIDQIQKRFAGWKIISIAFLVAVLFSWAKIPTLDLPYHWDEMGAYVIPAHELSMEPLSYAWPGYRPAETFFGHPPLIYLSLATIYKCFGESNELTRIYVLIIALIGLLYTYRLAAWCFDRTIGLMAALFLAACPLFFAQSGMFMGDIFITTLGVMTVFYALKRQWKAYLLVATLLVMTKETAVAIVAAICIYRFCFEKKQAASKCSIFIYLLPAFILLGFFIWQKTVTGRWVCNPYFNTNPLFYGVGLTSIIGRFLWIGASIITQQNRLVLTVLILLSFLIHKKAVWKKEYALFLLIIVFFLAAFTVIIFTQRYILAAIPYVCIAGAAAIPALIKQKTGQCIMAAFVLLTFGLKIYTKDVGYGNYDNDMQYTDIIQINSELCRYCEDHFADQRIVTAWPINQAMQYPYLGYVNRPLRVINIDDDPTDFDVLVDVVQMGERSEKLEDLIHRKKLVFHKRFTKNRKTIGLYLTQKMADQFNAENASDNNRVY